MVSARQTLRLRIGVRVEAVCALLALAVVEPVESARLAGDAQLAAAVPLEPRDAQALRTGRSAR